MSYGQQATDFLLFPFFHVVHKLVIRLPWKQSPHLDIVYISFDVFTTEKIKDIVRKFEIRAYCAGH